MRASFLRSFTIVWAVVLVGAAPLRAQGTAARQAFGQGIRHAQIGDTVQATRQMRRAIELAPDWAEAYFQLGLLHFRSVTSESRFMEQRLIAGDAFETALRKDPGNPQYLVELGKLLLMQEIRIDGSRVFQRALRAASRADPETLAETHYQLALLRETQWLRFRARHHLEMGLGEIQADLAFLDPTYVWEMLDRSWYVEGQGQSELDQMLFHLNQALAAFPSHVGAATRLLAYYYDEGLMDEFMAEARRFARAAPAEARVYFALGLGLHSLGRDDEAAGAFEYGLNLLPPDQRGDFLSVTRLMTPDDAEAFTALEGIDKEEARRRFWVASDPLLLTPSNEFRGEYLSRMAYADLRYGLPEYRIPGWRTDRGTIWVRYGEPLRQATYPVNPNMQGDLESIGRITTVWAYGRDGPVFLFRQNPGYRRAVFANDFRFYADDYRTVQPTKFSAPSIPSMSTVAAQVIRFRGTGGAMDLEVHAALPLDSLGASAGASEGTLETGLFVIGPGGRDIRRLTDSEHVNFRRQKRLIRIWRTEVPQGSAYLVVVEARDPLSWAAAVYKERLEAISFPVGEPSVSDVLLASEMEVLSPTPQSRADFRLVAEPTMSFSTNDPIGLYFELYNLLPDQQQFAQYELELVVTVEEIHRQGFSRIWGELADRFGFTEEGGRAVQLTFRKEERVVARDMIPEYFTFTLDDSPPGRYSLALTIRDVNADREFTTERHFEILTPGR